MKKADTIISHILHLPQFKSLLNYYCYRRFVSLLSPTWQKAIAFVYIRDDILYIVLRHPGFKNELNYNKDLLKSILTMLKQKDKKCNHLTVKRVTIFNSKLNSIIKKEKPTDTIPYYYELADGEFQIKSNDKELIEKFNRIKENILKNI